MARKARKLLDPQLIDLWQRALAEGRTSPASACKVTRSLRGLNQVEMAQLAGVSLHVIKAIEAGKPGVKYASLCRVAAVAGLRIVVSSAPSIEVLDPKARAAEKQRQREEDARAVAAGEITEWELNKRNSINWEGVTYTLPKLT